MHGALLTLVLAAGTFDWGTLPGELSRTPVDGQTTSDGNRVFMELRRSKARPDEVLSYCLERFAKAGFHIPKLNRQVQGPGPSLTALDVDTKVSYSVAVMPQSDGTLEVILGGADHASKVDEGEWPPAHPQAKSALRSTTEGARSLTFRVALAPKDVEAWYAAELTRAGFQPNGAQVWARDTERVLLHLEPRQGETVATVWAEGPHAAAPAKDPGGKR